MKPDEIKRCLEVCINDDCDNCKHSFGNCVRNLMTNTLDYINELEAEVERFKKLKGTFPKDDFLRSTKRISEDIDNLLKEMVGGNNATD